MSRPTSRLWGGLPLWGTAAAISLVFGWFVALRPGRSSDFWELRVWLDAWLVGSNPYVVEGLWVDYPPHTFLLLAPLAWLPVEWAPALLATFNVGCSVLAAWWTVRTVSELMGREFASHHATVLTAVLLTWGAFRTSLWLGQTMPISWWLALVAVRECERRPLLAGVCLGLATFKANLAIGIVLALLIFRRFFVLAVAGATVVGLSAIFARTVGESLWALSGQYLHSLKNMYGASGHATDWLSLNGIPSPGLPGGVVALYLGAALLLVAVLGWRSAREASARASLLALALLWTLQAFSHQRFNLVLAAPAVLLMLPEFDARKPTAWGMCVLAVVLGSLALDVPLLIRLVGWPYAAALLHRVLIVGLFGLTAFRLWRALPAVSRS